MKKFSLVFFLAIIAITLKAQRSKVLNDPTLDDHPIHFGFCLGLNSMDFTVKTNYQNYKTDSLIADVSKPSTGFHIQIISSYRLGEYLDLRFLPGISFGQRNLNFFKGNKLVNDRQRLESNFLEFPLLLKYKSKRLNNFRPYIISGGNFRVDLAKTFSEDDQVYLDLKPYDIYFEIGAGLDFYLPYFKFSTELKLSYGFLNMIKRRTTSVPKYQDAIESLNSSLVMLSFHFE